MKNRHFRSVPWPGYACDDRPGTHLSATSPGQIATHRPGNGFGSAVDRPILLRAALADLTSEKDYRLWFEPYWARVHPYRVNVKPGAAAEATIVVKNFLDVPTVYELKLVCPPGLRVDPSVATVRVEAGAARRLPVRVSAAQDAAAGLALVAIDITQDGVRRGQLFDVIVNVG